MEAKGESLIYICASCQKNYFRCTNKDIFTKTFKFCEKY